MKALIYNGKVVEIAEESNDVASPFEWINISNTEPVPEEGWSYDGMGFTAQSPKLVTLDELRAQRNTLLQETDRVAFRHYDGKDPVGLDWEAWTEVRQALRDLTDNYVETTEDQINWPTLPSLGE